MAKRPQTRTATPATTKQIFMLPGELVEQCRDAVVALSGPPVQLTLTRLVTDSGAGGGPITASGAQAV